jgi:hypothetical protein
VAWNNAAAEARSSSPPTKSALHYFRTSSTALTA